MQLVQHLLRDVDLPASAVHQQKVRKPCKASELPGQIFFFQLFRLFQAVFKASRQNLAHAGIVIRSCYRFDFEFSVIAALGLSLFINDHRADIFKAADVGNIERLHPVEHR